MKYALINDSCFVKCESAMSSLHRRNKMSLTVSDTVQDCNYLGRYIYVYNLWYISVYKTSAMILKLIFYTNSYAAF